MREMSVQGIFGHFNAVSMFSSLGHGSRGQHLFLLYVSTLTFICFSPEYMYLPAYKQCFCFPRNPLQLRDLENHSCGFTNWLLESPEEQCVMSNLFMFFRWVEMTGVSASVFSVFPILKNALRKLFPAIVIMGVDDYNSELQVSVPGSFLIQLKPSEPFMF